MSVRFVNRAFVVALAVTFATFGSAAEASGFNPPRRYYLALGDSVAFGAQLGKFFQELSTGTYDPSTFNTGYVDDFATGLRRIDPGLAVLNLSCPGETTSSFMSSCSFHSVLGFALHADYAGSQEEAALTFLRDHPGQVSPITITLGLNDALLPCAGPTFLVDVSCIHATMPAALQTVPQNLAKVLTALRQASPSSEIIVMTYYNAFFVEDPSTDSLISSLNEAMTNVASANHARVADTFTPFNRTGDEAASVCTLTLMCPNRDFHPSDAGYGVIAQQFWTASGYGRVGS